MVQIHFGKMSICCLKTENIVSRDKEKVFGDNLRSQIPEVSSKRVHLISNRFKGHCLSTKEDNGQNIFCLKMRNWH